MNVMVLFGGNIVIFVLYILAKLTPRATEPSYVPGLNLETSPRAIQTEYQPPDRPSMALEPYTENRILTPSRFRQGHSPKREFGTQTANISGMLTTRLGSNRNMEDFIL